LFLFLQAKLTVEIEEMQRRAEERTAARLIAERESADNQANMDVTDNMSMDVCNEGILV
jgi:hypothetical protein